MGGRGASFNRGGAIGAGEKDLKFEKVGKSFNKLPATLQKQINDNLKMSTHMKNDILNGRRNKITDEWTTGVGKQKVKVITDVVNGSAVYTLKQGNKILKKNVSKERVANAVASFYLDLLNG